MLSFSLRTILPPPQCSSTSSSYPLGQQSTTRAHLNGVLRFFQRVASAFLVELRLILPCDPSLFDYRELMPSIVASSSSLAVRRCSKRKAVVSLRNERGKGKNTKINAPDQPKHGDPASLSIPKVLQKHRHRSSVACSL